MSKQRTWLAEGGHELILLVKPEQWASITLVEPGPGMRAGFYRKYEWHETDRAEREAEALATLGHMQEVNHVGAR